MPSDPSRWSSSPDTVTEMSVGNTSEPGRADAGPGLRSLGSRRVDTCNFPVPPTRMLAEARSPVLEEEHATSPLWLDLSPSPEGGFWLGPYQLLEVLAVDGPMALVHARRSVSHGPTKNVVLRVPTRPEATGGPIGRAMASLADRLATAYHPNLAPLVDAGEAEGRPYLAYAAPQGTNLRRIVETLGLRSEALPFSVAAWIGAEALRGLAAQLRSLPQEAFPVAVADAHVLVSVNGEVQLAGFALETGPVDRQVSVRSLGARIRSWLTGGDLQSGWADRHAVPKPLADILEVAERPNARAAVIADALDAWRATVASPMTPVLLARFLEEQMLFAGWGRAFGARARLDEVSFGGADPTLSAIVVAERPVDGTPASGSVETAPFLTNRPRIEPVAQVDAVVATLSTHRLPSRVDSPIPRLNQAPRRVLMAGGALFVMAVVVAGWLSLQHAEPSPPPKPGIHQVLIGGE